jgi:SAM-dependent methyltransferase
MNNNDSHWNQIAQSWHLVGFPLRPSHEDIICFERAVKAGAGTLDSPMRALILGVTPELSALKWPAGTTLSTLDGSLEMIKAFWNGPSENAIVGSWIATSLDDSSLDMIVCDGGIGLLSYPQGQLALFSEIRRILAPNGIFTARLFTPGCHSETIDHIASDLDAGAITSLDVLKFRLWGALQADAMNGVRPRDVVKNIELVAGSLQRLVDHFGWSTEHVATLEFHRNSQAVYCLSSVDEVLLLVDSLTGLEVVSVENPQHAFGDRCPIISMQRVQ